MNCCRCCGEGSPAAFGMIGSALLIRRDYKEKKMQNQADGRNNSKIGGG
jgi:hypothetical protein